MLFSLQIKCFDKIVFVFVSIYGSIWPRWDYSFLLHLGHIVDGIQAEVQANSGEKRYFYLKIGEKWLKMAKIPLFHTFLVKKITDF